MEGNCSAPIADNICGQPSSNPIVAENCLPSTMSGENYKARWYHQPLK